MKFLTASLAVLCMAQVFDCMAGHHRHDLFLSIEKDSVTHSHESEGIVVD